jgi:5-methylcytosine-specific restriction endonuclease McrA
MRRNARTDSLIRTRLWPTLRSTSSSNDRNSIQKHYIKIKLYRKQRGVCPLCGKSIAFIHSTIDHIIPLARGGTWSRNNLQLTHYDCNQEKGCRTNIEYLEDLKK